MYISQETCFFVYRANSIDQIEMVKKNEIQFALGQRHIQGKNQHTKWQVFSKDSGESFI